MRIPIHIWNKLISTLVLVFLLLPSTPAVSAENIQAVIITNTSNKTHSTIIQTVQSGLQATGVDNGKISNVDILDVEKFLKSKTGKPVLLVTIGTAACAKVLKLNSDLPLLCAAIPRLSFDKLITQYSNHYPANKHAKLSALFLDQPLERRFELIQEITPQAKKIGVVFGPDSLNYREEIKNICKRRGLSLQMAVVHQESEIIPALDDVLEKSGVMLGLVDPLVFNRLSARNVLLTAYHWRVPLIGISPSYVHAGALASLYSTPAQIGQQLAEILKQYLRPGKSKLPKPSYPEYFGVAVNYQVAEFLGIHIESEKTLQQKISHKVSRKP